jgi:hypothetical protein
MLGIIWGVVIQFINRLLNFISLNLMMEKYQDFFGGGGNKKVCMKKKMNPVI